ncbi:MAG: hypothetical protein LBC78_01745, partial [Oscillospiraceae bacterium]|jgi:hypothetical protein|nr:hypothetical protein [Oscillospiraceae bacterium]
LLGSSIYLALITGEVMSFKLPIVTYVLKEFNAAPGSEEADCLSAIAVSLATLLLLALITLCVVLVVPLTPLLTGEAAGIISANTSSALFGVLATSALGRRLPGGYTAKGRLLGLVAPVIFVALVIIFDKQLSVLLGLDAALGYHGSGVIMSAYSGAVIILTIPITYFSTRLLYRRGAITLTELRHGDAISR